MYPTAQVMLLLSTIAAAVAARSTAPPRIHEQDTKHFSTLLSTAPRKSPNDCQLDPTDNREGIKTHPADLFDPPDPPAYSLAQEYCCMNDSPRGRCPITNSSCSLTHTHRRITYLVRVGIYSIETNILVLVYTVELYYSGTTLV